MEKWHLARPITSRPRVRILAPQPTKVSESVSGIFVCFGLILELISHDKKRRLPKEMLSGSEGGNLASRHRMRRFVAQGRAGRSPALVRLRLAAVRWTTDLARLLSVQLPTPHLHHDKSPPSGAFRHGSEGGN